MNVDTSPGSSVFVDDTNVLFFLNCDEAGITHEGRGFLSDVALEKEFEKYWTLAVGADRVEEICDDWAMSFYFVVSHLKETQKVVSFASDFLGFLIPP